jgi:hypothetical protein
MRELDQLSPDQRAVLSLVLMQDKSFQDVASMLGMSEQAVRDRAHAALDALAGDAEAAPAMPVSNGHRPAAARGLGEEHGPVPERAPAGGLRPATPNGRPSSRLGGGLLLGAIVIATVAGAILLSGAGKGSGGSRPSASTGAAKTATGTAGTGTTGAAAPGTSGSAAGSGGAGPKTDKVLALTPVEPSLKAAGVAYVFSDKGKRAFYVAIEGLPAPPAGSFYAVWLYNSPTSAAPLGRAPSPSGSTGRTEGGGALPSNARVYHRMVISRETDPHATHPGETVLSGPFALH